jgi:hypothetical protein
VFQISLRIEAIYVAADKKEPKELLNLAGSDIFYKNAADVDSGDTKLEDGQSAVLTEGVYVVSAERSEIGVRQLENLDVRDNLSVAGTSTLTGATTVAGKLHAEGEVEIEGDLNHDGAKVGFCGSAPVAPSTVKKAALTANELATELAKMGIVKIEA